MVGVYQGCEVTCLAGLEGVGRGGLGEVGGRMVGGRVGGGRPRNHAVVPWCFIG